jgi:hypothetical protein
VTAYFEERMLIEQPGETPEQLLARYQQQARAWRHRQSTEVNETAAMFAGDFAYMLEQLTGALSAQPPMREHGSLVRKLREAADVAYKGSNDSDPAMLHLYADKIRRGYPGGGSNLTAAVARVLDVVADALVCQPPVEPVSIADMAPGTTFTATLAGDRLAHQYRVERHLLNLSSGWAFAPDDLDPSTIRDVNPPPATPEEGS